MRKKHILIGTAGHVDHGKTTLIAALTGIEAHRIDRLKEEKKRGITIDLGYAYLPLPGGGVASVIDVPGHEKFIKNMLAGAGGMDLVLLVIAADDGVMPQTREHLNILHLLGAQDGIVVLTKSDLADEQWRALVQEDICETVAGTFLENAPILAVSSHTGQGLDALKALIFEKIQAASEITHPLLPPFRVPVDRVFSVDGFGTVITGTLTEGMIKLGDAVAVYPANRPAKVRHIQVHGGDAEAAFAGQRVALNLSGVRREDIQRGCVLAPPGTLQPTRMLDVKLTVLPGCPREIRTGSRLHFYYGTHNALCKAVLLGCDRLEAGQEAYAQLRFTEEVAVKQNDRFVTRFYSPMETVGGGIVLHAQPKKHRKGKAAEIEKRLKIREQAGVSGDENARILQAIADEGPNLTPLEEILKQLGYSHAATCEAALDTLARQGRITRVGAHHAIDDTFRAQLSTRLKKHLATYHRDNPLHPGIRKEALRSRLLPHSKPPLFDLLLQIYIEAAVARLTGDRVALADFSPAYTPAQQQIREDIRSRAQAGGFTPPSPEELLAPWRKKAADSQQVLDALQIEGALITTEPGILFSTQAIQEAKNAFLSLAGHPPAPVTLPQFRDALATSRKFALSLLEYFDRTGFTRKEGDARIIR
ncbi:MAG: selenocysteine-specific translation elongation factor [Defluviitaleaceae bacterium]|nr:selenocysteine-specific translation elongation factor [Defluviitaleaceae bacterium]MCL2204298.1 selenocysteine-specific translation elongation factor [Defluviitaleaceae bacterium]MCL2240524.1 selenocysteine-specific translation elongation factor [Defluviitaleaceae bacterium]